MSPTLGLLEPARLKPQPKEGRDSPLPQPSYVTSLNHGQMVTTKRRGLSAWDLILALPLVHCSAWDEPVHISPLPSLCSRDSTHLPALHGSSGSASSRLYRALQLREDEA